MSNFGLKVLLAEPPEKPGGLTKCFVWNSLTSVTDLHDPVNQYKIFEFFLEVLRVSVASTEITSETVPLTPEDRRIRIASKSGEFEVSSVDMSAEFTAEEIRQLEQIQRARTRREQSKEDMRSPQMEGW